MVQPILFIINTCHRRVLKFGFRHHGLNREWYPRQIQIPTNQFLTNQLYHFLTNGANLGYLLLIATDLTSAWMTQLVAVFLLVWPKPKLEWERTCNCWLFIGLIGALGWCSPRSRRWSRWLVILLLIRLRVLRGQSPFSLISLSWLSRLLWKNPSTSNWPFSWMVVFKWRNLYIKDWNLFTIYLFLLTKHFIFDSVFYSH